MVRIECRPSPVHGLGVFATATIEKGELIEACGYHALPIERGEASLLCHETRFTWPNVEDWEKLVLPLGFGIVYNHSGDNNAHWETNVEADRFEFYADRRIEGGDEIFTNYGLDVSRTFDDLTAAV